MKNLLLTALVTLNLIACNSGGNGGGSAGGPGTPSYTHNELASKFVSELNLDPDFDVTLVKSSTLQADYIVIYDPYTDSYDSINIDLYNPAYDNAADYYYNNSDVSFYDLDVIPGHYETYVDYDPITDDYVVYDEWVPTRYQDYYTGITFEKTASTPKDLAKVAAIKEVAELDKKAKFLSSNFGLSLERGKEVARLAAHWKKASLKGMTDKEQDNFSTELLGFSITQGKTAVESSLGGSSQALSDLVEQAAAKNGITPEHASKLMSKVFGL